MSVGLTRTQADLLGFIARYQTAHDGASPSFGEMAAELGHKSKAHIGEMLDALEQRGHIRRLPNKARAIEVIPQRAVTLRPEIHELTRRYARKNHITIETAANELLRDLLGAA